MPDSSDLPNRKIDHIRINLQEDVQSSRTNGLERYDFTHHALPEINLEDVDPGIEIFGKKLKAPILISSMTGGAKQAEEINKILARTAEQARIALGVGSQRAAIEHAELERTFQIRACAPDILLFANLGAVQLNYQYSVDECRQAVEMIEADALFLHLNALQEALQPEGQTRFGGLLKKIEDVCRHLPVPVVVKEVGWGISGEDARRLQSAGVAAIDVAGSGGTSWSQVEMHRIEDARRARIAADFRDWGIPTAESILQVKESAPEMMVFASGGIRNGIEVAKCISLGASMVGMAAPFLKPAVISLDETNSVADGIIKELQICMFACGARSIQDLQKTPLSKK